MKTTYRRVIYCLITLFIGIGLGSGIVKGQKVQFINEFQNSNHPEIGYWFISPNLYENDLYLKHLDTIASKTKYTMVFLTAREGANFYLYEKMHPIFKKLVEKAHGYGMKVGLQLWGNYSVVPEEVSHRMIIETEAELDDNGAAELNIKAKYIRFPDRLVRTALFKVYAFQKKGEGVYEEGSLKEITRNCESSFPDKETVIVKIKAGRSLKGKTVCVMTQQFTTQSTAFGKDEANRFIEALHAYSDIPFDGFALDEYGNKFVARPQELGLNQPFRGRWYSNDMALQYKKEKGTDLDRVLFDGRYAPEGKPEVRIKAINSYMDFMRRGGPMVENAVYDTSRIIFGKNIFNGIHNTYHNSLVNDEIWANGIGWWTVRRDYAQTDEKTPTTIQMGMALARKKNIMYNQYYDASLEPVVKKSLNDLRYGIRTHYHAMNDKRPLRWDLQFPEAIEKVNKVENCARILNKLNPQLPEMKLLVIFGMEALCNWYPKNEERGYYDLSNTVRAEERAVEIWNAGYLNALVPSELIEMKQLTVDEKGRAVINGHQYDAVLYLHPQYARESQLQFLEKFVSRGGKLMIEGEAQYNFEGRDISKRFQSIYSKATVKGYSLEALPSLGLQKNALPDGCKSEDGVYVYTNYEALMGEGLAKFSVQNKGHVYEGYYKGLGAISFDENGNIQKLAGAGISEIKKDGKALLKMPAPTDLYFDRKAGQFIIADPASKTLPLVNQLLVQTWVDSVDLHGREVFMPAEKYKWDWGQATFLHSLVRLYEHSNDTDKKKYFDYIKTAMDATYPVANGKHPNAVASAHGMAFLARITGDEKYWKKAQEIYNDYLQTPRCSNGGVSHRSETKELWDDTVFMLSMFLLEMYKSTGDEKYLADFLEQFRAHDEKLTESSTGLWVHAWDSDNDDYDDGCSQKGWPDKTSRKSSEIWARGNAWIGMALSDALRTVGRKSSYWKPFEKAFKNYVNKMVPYQDKNSGMWYQLITIPEAPGNFLESSCTAMLAYTLSSGLELNILSKGKYEPLVQKAYEGLQKKALRNPGGGAYLIPTLVSGGTCVGDRQYYLTRKITEGTGFGYGSFILFGQSYEHYKGLRN